jgi:putative ABC transport system substrate-binding protein
MRKNRRRRMLVAAAALLAAPAGVIAQSRKPTQRPTIGLLMQGNPAVAKTNLDAFNSGLREFGYVEGKNIAIEYRWAQGDATRLPGLARDLAQRDIQVIVTGGTFAAQAAKNATSVIPIVSAGAADLAESGLVASLSRPGGNLTGATVAFPETATKQVEIMMEILKRAQRLAVLWAGPGYAFFDRQRKDVEKAASRLSVTWHAPQTKAELPPAFDAIAKTRPDFVVVLSTAFYFGVRKELATLAAQARLPAVYGFREYVDDGGLLSYGASLTDSFRQAAAYVDRMIKGAKPAELPVQLPARLELVINLKAARTLGLEIPRAILLRADAVLDV